MPDYPFFLPRKAALPNLENGPKIVVKKISIHPSEGEPEGEPGGGGGTWPDQTNGQVNSARNNCP